MVRQRRYLRRNGQRRLCLIWIIRIIHSSRQRRERKKLATTVAMHISHIYINIRKAVSQTYCKKLVSLSKVNIVSVPAVGISRPDLYSDFTGEV